MRGWTAFRICMGLLALFCAVGVARVVAVIGLQVPLDPNEGWNAYHALHAISGSALYPASNTFLYNNYPPLSYYIVGALGSLIGDNIVAGRVLSLISIFAVAYGIFLSARGMNVGTDSAKFCSLLFVAGLLAFTDYVGMDDPQLLGHAIAIVGLVILLKEARSIRDVVIVALLMTAAGFVKHNLIVLPVATFLWLAVFDRRSAVQFALSGVGFALAGFAIFRVAYGTDLLHHLISPRTYSFGLLTSAVANWLAWANVALIGLTALFALRRDDKYVLFVTLYAFAAILVGVMFAGGAGVDTNIWFDAMIALSLGTALTLDRLAASGWLRAVAAVVYMLPLAAGLALSWDNSWLERDFWFHPLSEEAATARADIAFIESRHGPALCEMLSFCYWAKKSEEVDVFNLGQAYETRKRSDDALVRLLDERHYATIEFDSLDDFALTPRVKQALLRDYGIDHQNDEGVFLVPR